MKKHLVIALFLFIYSSSNAQTFEAKVDSLISVTFKDKTSPGGAFLIAKNGKPVYRKSFGKANLELGVDLNNESIFQLGSITKQFTAISILMLAEQGKISLDAPVKRYIPDYPNGENITVHHLLTHTSGIKDFTKMKNLQQIAQKDLKPKEVIDFFKNETPDFLPGEKFEYNNSGYVILGYLIELTSGETYENYIQKHIFEKLGMKNSRYASDRSLIKNRAYGYQLKNNVYVNKSVISFNIPYASGSLMSTTGDMLIWQNALKNNLLLQPATAKKAFTKYSLNNGEHLSYGYGWHIKTINEIESREHGGSIFGFKSMAVYIPTEDIYVIALTNCDCNSPTELARYLAKVALSYFKN